MQAVIGRAISAEVPSPHPGKIFRHGKLLAGIALMREIEPAINICCIEKKNYLSDIKNRNGSDESFSIAVRLTRVVWI
jgi:hypothetical protein